MERNFISKYGLPENWMISEEDMIFNELEEIDGIIYEAKLCLADVMIKKYTLEENPQLRENKLKFIKNELDIFIKTISTKYITEFFGFCEQKDNNILIVLQYNRAGNLHDLIKKMNLSIRAKIELACQIVNGLKNLHIDEPKIIHNNLNAKEIFIAESFHNIIYPNISGFAHSRLVEDDSELVKNDGYSTIFSAPEVLNGHDYSIKSDIYSLGLIFYQIFSGKIPFYDLNLTHEEIKEKIRKSQLKPEMNVNFGDTPSSIIKIIHDCLNYQEISRPNCNQIIDSILEITENLKIYGLIDEFDKFYKEHHLDDRYQRELNCKEYLNYIEKRVTNDYVIYDKELIFDEKIDDDLQNEEDGVKFNKKEKIIFNAIFKNEQVSIRYIPFESKTELISMIQKEFAFFKYLKLPNVVSYQAIKIISENDLILVMDRSYNPINLKNLNDIGKLSIIQKLKISIQIAEGIMKLHEKNIIIKTLNINNILLYGEINDQKSLNFNASIYNFTNSIFLESSDSIYGPDFSPNDEFENYMALEIIENKTYGLKADIFSFGILLDKLFLEYNDFEEKKSFSKKKTLEISGLTLNKIKDVYDLLRNLIDDCMKTEENLRPVIISIIETLNKIFKSAN